MSEIKQIKMSVPNIVAKRGRKTRKNNDDDTSVPAVRQTRQRIPASASASATASAPAPVVQKATPEAKPSSGGADIAPKGGDPLPMLSTTTAVGGGKKKAKPAVAVPLPYNESKASPSPAHKKEEPAKTTPTVKVNPTKKPSVALTRKHAEAVEKAAKASKMVNIQPTKRRNFTLKRNFKAKKITITVENSSKMRKTRDGIRRTVANMPLADITIKLQARGLMRAGANVPEHMQRSMMSDVLMFPTPL
jgi:hypothetical protein